LDITISIPREDGTRITVSMKTQKNKNGKKVAVCDMTLFEKLHHSHFVICSPIKIHQRRVYYVFIAASLSSQ
jgi:hypothetical protein